MKYAVGDKVRVRKDLVADRVYGYVVFRDDMEKYCGKTMTVDKIINTGKYKLKDASHWIWTDEMLEDVKGINIFVDGSKVIAKRDNKVGIAKCSPEDEFDIFTGARIAIDRLEKQYKPYAWLKYSEPYYIPSASEEGLCRTRYYNNDAIDDRMKERGLVFKTEGEAIEAAKKMLAVLKEGLTMAWRKLTDLTDEEVRELLLAVFNVEKSNTKNIVRDTEGQLITADITTEWIGREDELPIKITDEIELYIDDFRVDFGTAREDRLRYVQWLLAHNVCWLAFDNPFLQEG